MTTVETLDRYLEHWAGVDPLREQVYQTILALAEAGRELSQRISCGPGGHDHVVGENSDGDAQKALDAIAHELVRQRLLRAGVAAFASEESPEAELWERHGGVAVAVDPLDGSSNIDANVSVGTIFSILPATGQRHPFLQPGSAQLAAGYLIYGPHTDLVLTVREGTVIFTLDRLSGEFVLTRHAVTIPEETTEFAINTANYRHWYDGTRDYIDECLAGVEGPRKKNFNLRWIASLVAETSRILARGGVFLYPRDQRPEYRQGRLRLTYEANPIALLIEQAGGRATTGYEPILDLMPTDIHRRTPLIFGSAREVRRIEQYKANPYPKGEHSPLFSNRGLFRH